jgi:hypothetical protein
MADDDITERDAMICRALATAIVVQDKLIFEDQRADTDRDAMEDLLIKMTKQSGQYLTAALNYLSANVKTW